MTKTLIQHTTLPNWLLSLFVGGMLAVFATGWVKIDNLEKKIVKVETSKNYIEQTLIRIENKIDKLDERVRKLEDK